MSSWILAVFVTTEPQRELLKSGSEQDRQTTSYLSSLPHVTCSEHPPWAMHCPQGIAMNRTPPGLCLHGTSRLAIHNPLKRIKVSNDLISQGDSRKSAGRLLWECTTKQHRWGGGVQPMFCLATGSFLGTGYLRQSVQSAVHTAVCLTFRSFTLTHQALEAV